MKIKWTSLIGLVLIIGAVCLGYFWDYSQAWMVEIIVAGCGFMALAKSGIESAGGKEWKGYLVAGVLFVGSCTAVYGGMDEDVMTTIIGAVIVILGVIATYILEKTSSSE